MSWLLGILVFTVWASYRGFKRPDFLDRWLMRPHRVYEDGEWYRVFSHGFIHADSTHLFLNAFVLWQFGSSVEDAFRSGELDSAVLGTTGPWSFPMMYFSALVVAAIPALRKHRYNPGYASLGASGAVSAVLMAYILLYPTAQLYLFFIVPMPAVVAGVLFFVYESHMNRRGRTRIAHDAHLYGALFGAAWVLAYEPLLLEEAFKALRASWEQWW